MQYFKLIMAQGGLHTQCFDTFNVECIWLMLNICHAILEADHG